MSGFRAFTLANVPVWVSWWHIIILAYLAHPLSRASMLFAVCITASVLVHEFGHAMVAKYFRLSPQILLTGFGGLCGHERAQRDRDDALIIAAGPGAGLLLGVVTYALHTFVALPEPFDFVVFHLMRINFIWSLVNLLPLWPLDGGQLYRLGMLRLFKPVLAERITHVTALVVLASLLALFGMNYVGMFGMMIAITLGLQNVQALQHGSGTPVRRQNKLAAELFRNAALAYERGDHEEAARLCHQLRAESNVAPEIMKRMWALLGVATTRKGEYQEALSYLRRAPDSAEVVEALAQCFYQLEMYEALEALTQTKAFERLPRETRDSIVAALVEANANCRRCG